MLKGKRSVSACSLSSCRIRAEALARAFNNRIWPCVWVSQRSSSERDDGMSNGIDDEEEFFDASPSPVELEDESLFCQQHSSAATEAGRAKLYELLQQHASDDAIDVFYDVSEDANLTDTASNMCLNDDKKESSEIQCESSQSCEEIDVKSNFSNNSNSNGKGTEFTCANNNHAADYTMKSETLDPNDPVEPLVNNDSIQIVSDPSAQCDSINESNNDSAITNDLSIKQEIIENNPKTDKTILEEIENVTISKENSLVDENEVSEEIALDNVRNEDSKNNELPSLNLDSIMPVTLKEESSSNSIEDPHTETESQTDGETVKKEDDDKIVAEVKLEIDSPSSSSDSSEVKTTSPTSRLHIFEEARPKISRTTSLKTGKTPPGTPSRKKIVRFADVLGLDLEDVRHIMSGDLPHIPSSAYTDLNLKDVDLPACEPICEKIEINRRDSSCWQTVQGATAPNALYPLFAIPGEQPDFLDRLRYQGICLETVIVSEMNVQCTCRVMNYGYHKKVVARYTVNDWQSSNDIDASYVTNSSNGETDTFAFSIFLSPLNKNVKFALKYIVNNQEYWDNNGNQNYCLSYHSSDHMHHHLPSPLWQHQFW